MREIPGGRIYTRSALVRLLPAEHTPTPLALTDLLARELDDYAEIIVGPAGRTVEFMTRADGPGFTERGRVALEQLGMPAEAVAHHDAMSELFEHRRAFLKLEWLVTAGGVVFDGQNLDLFIDMKKAEFSMVYLECVDLPRMMRISFVLTNKLNLKFKEQ